MNFQLSTY